MRSEARECPRSLLEASAPNELVHACGQPELHILSAITVSLISRLSFVCSVNLRDLSGLERNWTTCNSMEIGSVGAPAHTLA